MKNDIGADTASEIARLQKKLIPLNIFVMILCIVAAVSLLVAPLITIDLGKAQEALSSVIAEEEGQYEDGGENGSDNSELIVYTLSKMDYKINLTTVSFMKIAFADDAEEYIIKTVAAEMKAISDSILIDVAVPLLADSLKDGVDAAELDNLNGAALLNEFKKIEEASPYDVDTAINGFTQELKRQIPWLFDGMDVSEFNDGLRGVYDDVVANSADGKFTSEGFICVALLGAIGGEDGAVYTCYEDLLRSLFSTQEVNDGSSAAANVFYVIRLIARYVSYTMFFFIGVWVILFLFALLHIFMKNKRFTMWYVKLFGFYPCLVFGIAPLVAKKVISGTVSQAYAAMFAVLSSLTWISGACYLLLWIVSIFWAHPIKKKIRALINKQ